MNIMHLCCLIAQNKLFSWVVQPGAPIQLSERPRLGKPGTRSQHGQNLAPSPLIKGEIADILCGVALLAVSGLFFMYLDINAACCLVLIADVAGIYSVSRLHISKEVWRAGKRTIAHR